MSVLDFLILVLEKFNSFNLNAFFQLFFCLFLPGYKDHLQSFSLGAVSFTELFGLG